mgnify:FL=1|jgi:chromosome segregation ATPase
MSDENYIKYYVDVLTNTMHDAIVRNVSLQASNKMSEDNINELNKAVTILDAELGSVKEKYEVSLMQKNNEISQLRSQVEELSRIKQEYDVLRSQSDHVNTFRDQLVGLKGQMIQLKSQHEIEVQDLKKQIEYLQMSPAKRKKIDELNKTEIQETNDGGTF